MRRRQKRDGGARGFAPGLFLVLVALLTVAAALIPAVSAPASAAPSSSSRPNIVFILTDDLSWNLITPQIAPHIVQLEQQGETFSHYDVADSLCCPSRSTIFTGLFPHDTKVTTNMPPYGGYTKFVSQGLSKRTYAVALHNAGYQTSMLGKYLNGYGDPKMTAVTAPVPPGWSDWHVSNNSGYAEFNYSLNDNGTVHFYGGPTNYGVDVLNADAQSFIQKNAASPFSVEVATFAPHAPYAPAPRNASDFPGLTEPRDPSFNAQNVNPPLWLGQRPVLGPKKVQTIDQIYRKRAQAVESVDKLVADTEATLAREGLSKKTYIFFSSDNGYHLGQHRLDRGKQTAFDTDINVPLIVSGPGVPHGKVVPQVAQNVDLYPTFVQLAGARSASHVEGHSLVSLLHPTTRPAAWRTVALVEHQGGTKPGDPDFEGGGSNPTTYEAIRVLSPRLPGFAGPVNAVYVEYADSQHEMEYYNVATDPSEIRNVAASLSGRQKATLHRILVGLEHCHSGPACWRAGQPA